MPSPKSEERTKAAQMYHESKGLIYVGILTGGGVQSDVISELQIISQDIFDRAREILTERSSDYAEGKQVSQRAAVSLRCRRQQRGVHKQPRKTSTKRTTRRAKKCRS